MNFVNGANLLNMVSEVALSNDFSNSFVFDVLEEAISTVYKNKYGFDKNIKVRISKNTGEISMFWLRKIVDVANDINEISVSNINVLDKKKYVTGDFLEESLPFLNNPSSFMREAKKVLMGIFNNQKRLKEYNDFKERVGDLVVAKIISVRSDGSVLVNITGSVMGALIPASHFLPIDRPRINDKIKACIHKVQKCDRGSQIILSRTSNDMLAKLLLLEVPEIYDGVIKIKSIARDPGFKAKVAVFCTDSNINPIACCVGVKAGRINAISNELCGEKIEIIPWENDMYKFVLNVFFPAKIENIVINEDLGILELVAEENQIRLLIGKSGQNIRLSSKLLSLETRISTVQEDSKKRMENFNIATNILMECLDLDETLANLLVASDLQNVDDIVNAKTEKMLSIDGIDEEMVEEIKHRAEEYKSEEKIQRMNYFKKHGADKVLLKILKDFEWKDIKNLVAYGVKTVEDLQEITLEELKQCIEKSKVSNFKIKSLLEQVKSANIK